MDEELLILVWKPVPVEASFASLNPGMAQEWHPTRNGDLLATNVAPRSGLAIWWRCRLNGRHVWQISPSNRTNAKSGCPYCSGRIVLPEDSLIAKRPDIAAQWYPELNGPLLPSSLATGSNKKVWWRCSRDPAHAWQATVAMRCKPSRATKCPFCPGSKRGGGARRILGQRLQARRATSIVLDTPAVAAQWHPTLNGSRKPSEFSAGSDFKAWWQCPRNPLHEPWQATINNRAVRGDGCPQCKKRTSRAELRVFAELCHVFPEAQLQARVLGFELDIYLPHHRVAVEYDGAYYHRDRAVSDKKKRDVLRAAGLILFRLRVAPLPIEADDIAVESRCLRPFEMQRLLAEIANRVKLSDPERTRLASYLGANAFQADDEHHALLSMLPGPPPHRSLLRRHPDLAVEWHPHLNGPLLPADVFFASNHNAWWQCSADATHVWQTAPCSRTINQTGCRHCALLKRKGSPRSSPAR